MMIPKQDCFLNTWHWTQKFVQIFSHRSKIYFVYLFFRHDYSLCILCWRKSSSIFCVGTRLFVKLNWCEPNHFPIDFGLFKIALYRVGWLTCQTFPCRKLWLPEFILKNAFKARILTKPFGKRTLVHALTFFRKN